MKKINTNKLIYFIAGEPSGDLHGGHLIRQINFLSGSSYVFRGLGGTNMQENGLTPVASFNKLSVMGFVEVLRELPFFIKLKKLVVNDILKHRPQKIVLIDYPGFNLRLAKSLKKTCSIPIIFYISPQLWAWKEKRIQIIKKYIDQMVVIFPFEVSWYNKRGVHVKYFGHPLKDIYIKHNKKTLNKQSVGIFLGSRMQEIKNHLPIIKKVVQSLKMKNKDIYFIVGVVSGMNIDIEKELGIQNQCQVEYNSFNGFNKSDVAIVASGTATLECAISNTPFLVIYKTSRLSWFITNFFIKVKYASIVNILAKKKIVQEFLQNNFQTQLIVEEISYLLNNKNQKMLDGFKDIQKLLGDGSAYNKTAKFLITND